MTRAPLVRHYWPLEGKAGRKTASSPRKGHITVSTIAGDIARRECPAMHSQLYGGAQYRSCHAGPMLSNAEPARSEPRFRPARGACRRRGDPGAGADKVAGLHSATRSRARVRRRYRRKATARNPAICRKSRRALELDEVITPASGATGE